MFYLIQMSFDTIPPQKRDDMLITIDTHNWTPEDRSLVAQALGLYETQTVTAAPEVEKPVRKRRTKAEMAADAEAAKRAEEAAQGLGAEDTAGMDDSTDESLAEEPTPDSENAESDEQAKYADATITEVVELATQLIAKDKTKMRAVLDQFGLRKVSDIPEGRMGEMAVKIREALA